jgi:hypothetical protein
MSKFNKNLVENGPQLKKTDTVIQSVVAQHASEPASQIAARLSKKGINISKSTLRRRFKEAGIQSMKLTSKPLLTDAHIKKRFEWATKYKGIDWKRIVFTDECSFHMKQVIRRVWKKRGEKVYVSTVKHPVKVHAWVCFSQNGFGKLILFRRTLNSKLMCKIYKNGLLSSVKRWFGDHSSSWKLLEDNDPKHMSKMSKTFKVENGIQSLPWPSQSPDCNPIENVWALMKLKINKQPPTSLNNFVRRIKNERKNLPAEFAENLVYSMNNRIDLLIERKGDYINY